MVYLEINILVFCKFCVDLEYIFRNTLKKKKKKLVWTGEQTTGVLVHVVVMPDVLSYEYLYVGFIGVSPFCEDAARLLYVLLQ